MAIRDLVPWRWGEKQAPVKREEEHPFYALQSNMNRLFNEFFSDVGLRPFSESWGGFNPNLDITENDQEIKVSAELPGLDENDIEVKLANNSLTISGEKKQEKEDKGKNYYHIERSYGSFRRTIPLPPGVETNKVEAAFNKGVLTITMPKTVEAQSHVKKIPIKTR
ncbi:MAG: Hsp20/alpha crystallin family protein [Dehalococcoidia bacterium]|nr:MAG: Hsp20/alpha crystallin family protein [Dehalococcoidia bacterium]